MRAWTAVSARLLQTMARKQVQQTVAAPDVAAQTHVPEKKSVFQHQASTMRRLAFRRWQFPRAGGRRRCWKSLAARLWRAVGGCSAVRLSSEQARDKQNFEERRKHQCKRTFMQAFTWVVTNIQACFVGDMHARVLSNRSTHNSLRAAFAHKHQPMWTWTFALAVTQKHDG